MLIGSLTLLQIMTAAAAAFAGSTVLSTVGFGIGMVATPFLLLVLDPQTAVIMLNTVSVPLLSLIVLQNRRHLRTRETMPLVIAGIAGALAGVFILSAASDRALRISIVALILVLTAAAAFKFRGPIPKSQFVGPIVGSLVALMLTSLAIGGPLLVLFVLTQGWQRDTVRGSLALYFLFIMLIAVAGYAATGLYTSDRIVLTGIVTAPVLAGLWLGSHLARRMNERVFRKSAVAVIIVTSLVVLGRELLRL